MTTQIALARNAERAAALRTASRDLTPSLRLVVLACADHRVDPAHVLGIGPGDAVVLRNPGGRVTRDVLRSFAVLSTVAAIEELGTGFDFLVLHHTDCGLSRLAPAEHAALVAEYVGVGLDQVPALTLEDPRRAAEYDATLLAAMLNSPAATVTAAVYDLDTGLVEVTYSTSAGTES
jgi:carbonic anhydrase